MLVDDLDVFKLSHGILLKVYELTREFQKDKIFNLTMQLRRI